MSREDITERIAAILEDLYGMPMVVPMRTELESLFEPHEYDQFKRLLFEEFDFADDTLMESASTFLELVALIEAELFSENY